MERVINSIGLTSSILIAIMFVPQVIHVYKTKDTAAINYTFLGLNMVASSLGLVYSIYFNIVPMIVANMSAGLFSITLMCMKLVNDRSKSVDESPV